MDERTDFPPPSGVVRPGARLNGLYEIVRLIGESATGEVYKGLNLQTRDPVAVKMMRCEMSAEADALGFLRRKASLLLALQHEAIARYFVFSVDPDLRRAYFAMEYVDGISLSDRLAARPLALSEVQLLMRRVAGALHAAHRLGVVHGDIDPDHLILPDGDVRRVKIVDFRVAPSRPARAAARLPDRSAASVRYAAPEQRNGGEADFKSDIYSLGLVLADALGGRPHDAGGSFAGPVARRRGVPDLSDIPPSMRPLLEAMLQPDPARRPPSMAAVADGNDGPPADPPTVRALHYSRPRSEAPASRGRILTAVAAFVAVAGVLAIGYRFRDVLATMPSDLISSGGKPSDVAPRGATPPIVARTSDLPPPTATERPAPPPPAVAETQVPAPPPAAVTETPAPTPPAIAEAPTPPPPAVAEAPAPPSSAATETPAPPPPAVPEAPAPTPSAVAETLAPPPPAVAETSAPPPPAVAEAPAPPSSAVTETPAPSPPAVAEAPAPPAPAVAEAPAPPSSAVAETQAPPPPAVAETPAPSPSAVAETQAPPPPAVAETPAPSPPAVAEAPAPTPSDVAETQVPPPPAVTETPAPSPPAVAEAPAPPAPAVAEAPAPPSSAVAETQAPPPPAVAETPAPSPSAVAETQAPPPPAVAETPAPSPPAVAEAPAPTPSDVAETQVPPPPAVTETPALPPPAVAETPPPSPPAVAEAPAPPPAVTEAPTPTRPAVAETPEAARTPTPAGSPFAETRMRFLLSYDGGSCFLARPAPGSVDANAMQAFGVSAAAFSRFSEAYRDAFKVAPNFSATLIDEAECPALELLRLARTSAAIPPRIELTSREVGPAKPLAGIVSALAGRTLKLVGVHYSGAAFAIRVSPPPNGDSVQFSERLRGTLDPGDLGREVAVLAIVSDRPFAALGESRLGRIDELVPKLIAEWAAAGGSADAQFATLAQ